MWKRFVNDYLSYTHKERVGIFIVLSVIIILIFVPFLFSFFVHQKQYDHSKFAKEIAQLKAQQIDSFTDQKYSSKNFDEENSNAFPNPSAKDYPVKESVEVFYFDPNIATTADWKRLGIRDKTIETIQKYLSKGGHFYKPEDLSKIWGLRADDVKRLLPYVIIQQKKTAYVDANADLVSVLRQAAYTPKVVEPVDINSADTTLFIALPGIGSKLAQRIINFRTKLGGFYAVEQVAETFGFPDSTYQKIKAKLVVKTIAVKKININTALSDEMKAHPYIRYALANAIIQYRNQHGNFSSIADIKKIVLVTDEMYKKAEPYITIEP